MPRDTGEAPGGGAAIVCFRKLLPLSKSREFVLVPHPPKKCCSGTPPTSFLVDDNTQKKSTPAVT